jgi:hypothetical protein
MMRYRLKIQMNLPWGEWDAENPEILAVAEKFVFANCYNPQIAGQILQQTTEIPPPGDDSQCQVSETYNWQGFVEKVFFTSLNKNL